MNQDPYVLGADFGTDSVRILLVNARTGEERAGVVRPFPRWQAGLYCDPARNRYRQHPLDHLEALTAAIRDTMAAASGITPGQVRGIGVATTGSTPAPVDEDGTVLALRREFSEDPDAMFVLWKDHTAVEEAAGINSHAKSWPGPDYTCYSGGVYSSEWFWSKILHLIRRNGRVRAAAFSWAEHCDWIPAVLTGNTSPRTMKRSRCAAGHKALWHASWGGLPPEAFWTSLDRRLAGLRARLYRDTCTCDVPTGRLSPAWVEELGLSPETVVSTGAFDAHLGALGGGIEPYVLCKVIGTSTCDILTAPLSDMEGKLVRGICGQVDGSVQPGMLGMEAGQSAFGDVYAWFRQLLSWPLEMLLPASRLVPDGVKAGLRKEMMDAILPELSRLAEALPLEDSGLIALDWLNGRRTPDADQRLTAAITGLTLGVDAPRLFRALVEATAFGSRRITSRFAEEGVPIRGVIALGGIPKKSPLAMQVLADVLEMPIQVARPEQAVALGSAMAAATAAGLHPDLAAARRAMGQGFETTYHPEACRSGYYRSRYEQYVRLGRFAEDGLS